MLINGVSLSYDRLPAVAVPPVVMPQVRHSVTTPTGIQSVGPYAGTAFHQHENLYDRSRQDSYDIHGRMVRYMEATGTRLDRLI